MNDSEVNKIIAEYMGLECDDGQPWEPQQVPSGDGGWCWERSRIQKYTESLDALIPVWEKLPEMDYHIQRLVESEKPNLFMFYFDDLNCKILSQEENDLGLCDKLEAKGETIQQAAAHAAAKAIMELSNEQ